MATTVHVKVYDARIAAAFMPGGMVYGQMRSTSRLNRAVAKAKAPVRTGAMRDSIDSDVQASGAFRTTYRVGVGTDHARFVLGGTTGPIRPRGEYLRVRPAPNSWYGVPVFRRSVRGQAANNFLGESLVSTFALRGLL
ncbi:HK97 gp10 family phage protein [Microbacterium sp. NPDC058389]|uniref:HK97 gp10 family phage protein n=1 Tax=Microbacterium sp. NPDC058389 TaxID=3346475 RepID=UPI00365774B8